MKTSKSGDGRRGLLPAWGLLLACALLAAGGAGDGAESDAGEAGAGVEVQPPSSAPPVADQDDRGLADPAVGSAGNPADGTAGLPGSGLVLDGAVLGAGGLTADSVEEVPVRRVPAGTRMRLTVDHEISTDLYRPGDAVVASLAEDVTDPSGEVLIPRGVKLLGRILTSEGSPGIGEPPVLEIAFETLSALNAEWAVEGAVINVPVVVDSRADIARRFQRNRSRDREVPGRILEGAIVVVELRAGVRVGPVIGPEAFPWDTLPLPDSLPWRDTPPRVDTLRPAGV